MEKHLVVVLSCVLLITLGACQAIGQAFENAGNTLIHGTPPASAPVSSARPEKPESLTANERDSGFGVSVPAGFTLSEPISIGILSIGRGNERLAQEAAEALSDLGIDGLSVAPEIGNQAARRVLNEEATYAAIRAGLTVQELERLAVDMRGRDFVLVLGSDDEMRTERLSPITERLPSYFFEGWSYDRSTQPSTKALIEYSEFVVQRVIHELVVEGPAWYLLVDLRTAPGSIVGSAIEDFESSDAKEELRVPVSVENRLHRGGQNNTPLWSNRLQKSSLPRRGILGTGLTPEEYFWSQMEPWNREDMRSVNPSRVRFDRSGARLLGSHHAAIARWAVDRLLNDLY